MTRRVRVPADVLRSIERVCSIIEGQLKHIDLGCGDEITEYDPDCELLRQWLRERWSDE